MGDHIIHNVLALVMVYEESGRQWVPCGNPLQYANIYILFSDVTKGYRFYGIDGKDGEVILDSEIYKGLKYNKATPIFHQWRDISRQVFGLKFESPEDADGFSNAVLSVLDPVAHKNQRRSSEVVSNSLQTSSRTVEQANIANTQNAQVVAQQQPAASAGVFDIWASQGQAPPSVGMRTPKAELGVQDQRPTQGQAPSTVVSRAVKAETATMPAAEVQLRSSVVGDQSQKADPVYDQSRRSQLNSTGMRRMSSQPSYENNENKSLSAGEENVVTRTRSVSFGNALEDAGVDSTKLGQLVEQSSNSAVSPMAPPPPPPPPPLLPGSGGLAEAIRASTLRKNPKPSEEQVKSQAQAGGTLGRQSGRNAGGNVDVMSEMARKLQERRAKTVDLDVGGVTSSKSQMSNGHAPEEKAPAVPVTPAKPHAPLPSSGGKESPRLERKWQSSQSSTNSSSVPSNVATTADLESLKKELTGIMRSEISAAKQDIIDAIAKMLNR